MKWQSVTILFVFALSIAIPPSLPFQADRGAGTEIGTLDVCHSATPSLSSNGDMTYVPAALYSLMPSPLIVTNIEARITTHFFLSFQDERPPEA